MAIHHLLTLALAAAAAAAAATPTPSSPIASPEVQVAEWEDIVSFEAYGAQMASIGEAGLQALAAERVCDLTLCTGVDFTGECSLWCYYENMHQKIPSEKRASTKSARYRRAKECWFYACVPSFLPSPNAV
ncbi:hypothetical protein CTA2_2174 [Colletotrichum tanaceti]|uniref:Secreted protein n=1 Tax=Colletotrichum tanaceti TaxID=1306861 RepID=A0A4U6XKF5_9PEZI|nr:hypothetical protein CTA2_2174 [Colletotrichum tanaceti]TKW55057.1 hypothetical protein CTA1_13237 [Colletotrichum tanaceti]